MREHGPSGRGGCHAGSIDSGFELEAAGLSTLLIQRIGNLYKPHGM